MEYCPICGNKGIRPDGEPCKCRVQIEAIYDDMPGVDVPPQYVGLRFSSALVPQDLGPSYGSRLDELHMQITTNSLRNHNLCICSPSSHGKTVWAYSCIQNLFRHRTPVCPIVDVLEFVRMMNEFRDKEDWYDVPYLFLNIPTEVTQQVRSGIVTIIERRVRRGNSTIFLYDGSWGMLTYGDRFGTLKNLQGDGSFHSVDVLSFKRLEEDI